MIKRSTWVMLIILLLLIAAYFIVRTHSPVFSTQATPTVLGNEFIFTQADGDLQSLNISDKQGHITQIQRDTSGAWIVSKPIPGPADQSLAGAAVTQVTSLRIITLLENTLNLKDAGLDFPAYTLKFTFASGSQHELEVGTLTPTSSGYYVRYDGGNIYVIASAGVDALVNLVTSPPYPPTETPSPTALITDTPTPGATVKPSQETTTISTLGSVTATP